MIGYFIFLSAHSLIKEILKELYVSDDENRLMMLVFCISPKLYPCLVITKCGIWPGIDHTSVCFCFERNIALVLFYYFYEKKK